jgi:uncharacterized membrane protein YcaP (DUF421 family)
MELIKEIFGEGKDLNVLQMSARAAVMFVIALFLIRLAGIKTFGKSSAFDNIIIIMLGAILSRAVVGVSPFFPTVFAGLTTVLMSRLVSWLSIKSKTVGKLAKGEPVSLFKEGTVNKSNLYGNLLTEHDLMQAVRKEGNTTTLNDVEEVLLERSGDLSVIKKKK